MFKTDENGMWKIDGGVSILVEPSEKWIADHQPTVKTPVELREQAYETEKLINWQETMLTVDEAKIIFLNYLAEGSQKADEIMALIATAKASIRDMYPDV